MRKLILEEWISLDGYAADVNGETAFFPTTEENRRADEDQLKFLDTVDTILLGRKTYELFAGFWPKVTRDQEILADKLNSIPKVVLSDTLRHAPWGKWPDAKIIREDAVSAVKKLKHEQGKDIVLWGSISIAQALMTAGLIDEYHIQICPVRLGTGRALFPTGRDSEKLQLIETRFYDNTGLIFLKYVLK